MKFIRAFLVFVFLISGSILHAQSALHCLTGGQYLPVAELSGKSPLCFTGDSLVKGKKTEITLLPADSFGDGFVEVDVRKNRREGVYRREDGILTFATKEDWYLLVCTITPDRDMNDCYFALTLDEYGKKSYYCRELGNLQAGKTKTLRIYTRLGFEIPEQLHIFSGMEEIRTSLIPDRYTYQNGTFVVASK